MRLSRVVCALIFAGVLNFSWDRAHAQDVECLANISTGFDQELGEPVPEGEIDDDYEVDSGFGFESTYIVSSAPGFPIPPWIPNTEECRWISSTLNTNAEPIDHIFEIGIELPDGIDPSRVTIIGRWAIDNSITDVIINERSTGISGVGGFTTDFEFPSDEALGYFEPGFNTIQFVVNNAPPNVNPLGLRVNACVGQVEAQSRSLDLSTGFDDAGSSLIQPGSPDPDYTIVDPDGSTAPATVSADGCGGGSWLPPRINSRWIGPEGDACEGPEGEYVYRTEVILPDDFELDRAVIKGPGVAVDDELVDVLVNEEPTGFSTFGSGSFQGFPVDFGRGLFVAGSNIIEFVVNNAAGGGAATGLHVDAQVGLGEPEPDVTPSLFSLDTGFDNETGEVIANDEGDDNWVVIGPPGSDIGPLPATIVSDAAWPIVDGPWFATTARSKWIGVSEPSSNGPPGVYTFRIVVEIPDGVDASQARLIATASSDNGATDILINGESTGATVTGAFNTLPALPADIGLGMFENGENVVDFLVSNAGDAANPVGLRVEGVVGVGAVDPNDISTGIGSRGIGPLPGGVEDPRYNVTGPAGSGIGPRAAVSLSDDRIPAAWVDNSDTARWIGLDGEDSVGPAGTYEYEITVQLGPEQNPGKAALSGGWAAAGAGVDVELNGVSLGLTSAGPDQLTPFPEGAGRGAFVPGENSLVFILSNAAAGPTGLYVSAGAATFPAANPLDISTGFDQDEGEVIEDDEFADVFDDDYSYTDPDGLEETSVLVFDDNYPIPPWIANSATSRWIGVLDPDSNGPPGEYRFETSVELTADQAEDAVLVGSWSTDNSGIDVEINGVSTGITAGGFGGFTQFPPEAGQGLFEGGFNRIVFVVSNAGDAPNPVGLRVDAVVDVGETSVERPRFRRGDANDAGSVNISSAVFILSFLFDDSVTTLPCMDAGDINNDGAINITDPVNLLNHLFGTAAPPAPPGLENCGEDPDPPGSPGDLGCETYTSC